MLSHKTQWIIGTRYTSTLVPILINDVDIYLLLTREIKSKDYLNCPMISFETLCANMLMMSRCGIGANCSLILNDVALTII